MVKSLFLLFITLGVLNLNSSFGQTFNSNSPAVPFNSRSAYPFGIMPTNLPTSGTWGKSSDAATFYTAWFNKYINKCSTTQYRVLFDDNSSTVSEGIGYGMLLAAYAGDKTTFDALWNFWKANKDSRGLMNWKLSGCSGVNGSNSATDADEDAAMALIIAAEQWPSATSPYTYKTEASTIIASIRASDIDNSTNQILNGDAWGTGNTCRNPSYLAPAYYREYAKIETSQSTFWNNTVSKSNSMLLTNRNATTGLVCNWMDNNGNPNNCNGNQEFGYDAIRNPWRMAVDVLWYGTSTATTAADICTKMTTWIKGNEANLKGPCAMSAANPSVGQYKNGTFSMIGLVPMGTSSTNQSSLNACYTSIVGLGTGESYFNETLKTLTLFVMSGNFWKPGSAGSTTCTTPTVSITASKTSLCNGSGNVTLTASGASTYSWSSGATTAAITVTPTTTTTYTITGTTATGGCKASANQIITVNSAPTIIITPATTSICSGSSLLLTAAGGNSYAWSNNSTATAITVSPTSTTTYTVTGTNSGGCTATLARTITVNAKPTITITPTSTTICSGGNLIITAAGGNNYVWNNNITTAAITVSPTSTSTYLVTGTNSGGCIATNSVVVSVNSVPSAPIVVSPVNYVMNATATALTANGTALKWYTVVSGGTALAPTPTPTTSIIGTTSYYVSQTLNTCESPRATIAVVVSANKAPTVSISFPVNNATYSAPASISITATAADADGTIASVKFYNGTTLLGTVTTSPYTYSWTSVTAGTYSITAVATDNTGSSTTSSAISIIVNATQTITLNAGWNIISFNIQPTSMAVSSIFSSLGTNLVTVKNADGFYDPAQAAYQNSLTTIENGKAYLVNVKTATSITVTGSIVGTTVLALKSGWNLVGYPKQSSGAITSVLSGIWTTFTQMKDFNGFYIKNGTLNSLTNMIPNSGYFIKVSADCTLTY